jgi:hypothetical protein
MSVIDNNERLLEKKPTIPKEVVEWLDAIFPMASPELDDSERLIFFRCGQRSVVDCIKSVYQQQNETLI